jgi:ankyrin repeat protein
MSLHSLVFDGSVDKVKKNLQRKNININALDESGNTALYYAVSQNHVQLIKLLVANGADVNIVSKNSGDTLLHTACGGEGDVEVVCLLISLGMNVNARNLSGETPLYLASQASSDDVVFILLEFGADPNIADKEGKTPLHQAFFINVLNILLKRGANPNIRDTNGATALHVLSEDYVPSAVQSLIDYGADVNIKDNDGNTPLHVAHLENVKILLKNGANYKIKNLEGVDGLGYLDMSTKEKRELVKKYWKK